MTAKHAGYLDRLFRPHSLIALAEEHLRDFECQFDGFIGTGVSGAAVVSLLGYHFNKPFAIVRKDDGSHSWTRVETSAVDGRFLIVDDLVASGRTMVNIVRAMKREMDNVQVVGAWMYQGNAQSHPGLYKGRKMGRLWDDYGDSLLLEEFERIVEELNRVS